MVLPHPDPNRTNAVIERLREALRRKADAYSLEARARLFH